MAFSMKKQPPVTLAFTNSKPLRSFRNRNPLLHLVFERMPPEEQPRPPEPGSEVERVAVLQVLLTAEQVFLRELQSLVEERIKNVTDIDELKQKVNNEDVFQIARFFFLLEELGCSTSTAVEELLLSHNKRIEKLINDGNFQFGSRNVLERCVFDDIQISTCMRTIKQMGRPVFSKNEIASLIFEQMKRDKATRTIDLMVQAKLLIEESAYDRQKKGKLRSSNRSYIMTDGALENAVANYLETVEAGFREIL